MLQATDKAQPAKFRDMAHELECDEDEAAFGDKVRKMAIPDKPKPDEEPSA